VPTGHNGAVPHDEIDEVAAELNRYLVEQAWFAPLYRVQGNFPSDADTVVEMLPTNTYPAIYDIYPAN